MNTIALDSVEAVKQRFDLVPKQSVLIKIPTNTLQAQYVAIEYLEQMADGLIDFDEEVVQQLLESLPVINV